MLGEAAEFRECEIVPVNPGNNPAKAAVMHAQVALRIESHREAHFSKPCLDQLFKHGHNVRLILLADDSPVGKIDLQGRNRSVFDAALADILVQDLTQIDTHFKSGATGG